MSFNQLPEHYQLDFEQRWEHALQRGQADLLPFVKRESINGYAKRYSFMEEQAMSKITSRAATTAESNATSFIRWMRSSKYDLANTLDEWDADELGQLIAPTGDYTENHGKAYLRACDAEIRDAIQGSVLTGENMDVSVAMPSTQIVDEDYVRTGSAVNSGLTFAKVARVKKIMDDNNVPRGGRVFAISPDDEQDLIIDVAEIKSSDFTQVQPITDGTLVGKTWMGFMWTVTTGLTTASNITNCLAWHRDYVIFGDGQKRANIDILPQRSHALQVRTRARMGAIRKQEEAAVICKTYHA